MGVSDRVTFHEMGPADAEPGDGYDLAMAFECIHDMSQPVPVLTAMRVRRRPRRGGVVVWTSGHRGASPRRPATWSG